MNMKKKLAVLLLSITAVVALAFGLAACKEETSQPGAEHEHSLAHTEAVEATCTEAGNAEYWYCAGCGKYFSDADAKNEVTQSSLVVSATGHTFVDGVCTVCGASEGTIEEEAGFSYYNLVKSIAEQGGFSVVIDTANTSFDDGYDTYTFESGELTLTFNESGEIGGYVTGKVLSEDGISASLQGYLANGMEYYCVEFDGEKVWARMSFDEMMTSIGDEEMAIAFMAMNAEQVLLQGLLPLADRAASKNSEFVDGLLEKVCASLFDVQTNGDEVTLVLDAEALSATYTLLTTSSVSEIIDHYFGSGSYQTVQNLVATFDTLTLENVIAYAEGFAGVSRTEIIGVINDVVASMGVEDIDVSDYLTPELLSLTVDGAGQAILGEDFVLSALAVTYLEQFKDATVVDLLALLYGPEVIDLEVIDSYAEMVLSLIDECASVVITTDAQGNVKTADITVNSDGDFKDLKITAGVRLVNGGKTDDAFVESLIAEVDALYDAVLTDGYVMDKIRISGYSDDYSDVLVTDHSQAVLTVEDDGSITLTVDYDLVVNFPEDYYGNKEIVSYQGHYVLTNVLCFTVYSAANVYEYEFQGTLLAGGITHTVETYENGVLVDSSCYDRQPSTTLTYYREIASENA